MFKLEIFLNVEFGPYQNFVAAVLFQSSTLKHRSRSADGRCQFLDKAVITVGELLDFRQLLLQDGPPLFVESASDEVTPEAALYPLTARVLQTMAL